MKQWLENILVQAREGRFRVFILCLALVFVVASLNKLSTYYTNSIQVTLEILDLPNDQVLINGDKLELELTVTTYGFNWLRYAIFPENEPFGKKLDKIWFVLCLDSKQARQPH